MDISGSIGHAATDQAPAMVRHALHDLPAPRVAAPNMSSVGATRGAIAFEIGRISEQHGAERRHRLAVRISVAVVDLSESRLRDVVLVVEMNVVAVKTPAVAHVEQLEARLASDGVVLNAIELRDLVGVDRRDQVKPRWRVEGLLPVFRRTRPGVPELDCPLVHA